MSQAQRFSNQVGGLLTAEVTVQDIDVNEETVASLALSVAGPLLAQLGESAVEVGELDSGQVLVCGESAAILIDPSQESTEVLYASAPVTEGSLSKKHFIASAKAIKEMSDRKVAHSTAHHTASIFAQANTRFDRSRYLSACGVGEQHNEAQEQEALEAASEFCEALQEFVQNRIPLEKRSMALVEQFDRAAKDGFVTDALAVVQTMAEAAGESENLAQLEAQHAPLLERASVRRSMSAAVRSFFAGLHKMYRKHATRGHRRQRVYHRKHARQFRESVDVWTTPVELAEQVSALLTMHGWEVPVIETADKDVAELHLNTEVADAVTGYLSGALAYHAFESLVGNPARGLTGKLRITNYVGPGAQEVGGFQPTTGEEAPIPGNDNDTEYDDLPVGEAEDDVLGGGAGVACPECGKELETPADGEKAICPDCQIPVDVGSPLSAPDANDVAPAQAAQEDMEFDAELQALLAEAGDDMTGLPVDHLDPDDAGIPAETGSTDDVLQTHSPAVRLNGDGGNNGTGAIGGGVSMGVDVLRARHPELAHLSNADLLAVESVSMPKGKVLQFTKLADSSGVSKDACVVLEDGTDRLRVLFPKAKADVFRNAFAGEGIAYTTLTA